MKEYQNVNFSLLSQEEIDVLVEFLTDNKFIESDVLSQESIDKLVSLLLGDIKKPHMEIMDPILRPVKDILKEEGIRGDDSELCVLHFKTGEDKFIKLYVTNEKTNKRVEIFPNIIDREDKSSSWGYCMSPVTFNRLARVLDVKYAAETYEEICKLFARVNFGSEDAEVPAIYFPTNEHLIRTLL